MVDVDAVVDEEEDDTDLDLMMVPMIATVTFEKIEKQNCNCFPFVTFPLQDCPSTFDLIASH